MDAPKLRLYERLLVAVMGLGALLTVAGTTGLSLRAIEAPHAFTWMAGVGLFLVTASTAMSFPLTILRTFGRSSSGGVEYDQMRYYGHLKASAILLNLLWLVCLLGLLFALAVRLDAIELPTSYAIGLRIASVLTLVLVLNLTHAHYLSLRVPLQRASTTPTTAFFLLLVALTIMFCVVGVALTERSFRVLGPVAFDVNDAPLLFLATATFASIGLFVARPIPNVLNVFREDTPYRGRDYISRTKSVIFPAVLAFTLLILVVLLLLFVGVGTVGFSSPIQSFVMLFFGVALIVSVMVSLRLAQTEDTALLYKIRASAETRTGRMVLYSSLGIASLFAVAALYLLRGGALGEFSQRNWIDFFSLSVLIGVGPYGFWVARRARRIRRLEERFPDFLRDVAASHRGGLTLSNSVSIAAKGEYGELTPEIRKMADQLSWNVPFNEALESLMDRVRTPLIQRAITLIIEASRSGGSTTDVLLAAARDAREIKNLENERRQTMGLYTMIIYITFFVFLTVAAVLYGQFVPEIVKATGAASGRDAAAAGLGTDAPSLGEYRAFYFMAAVAQSIGNGLVGGLFQTGKVEGGLRHAFLMLAFTYVTFVFLIN